jgi:F0F1-type ATP synthase assembly protein I
MPKNHPLCPIPPWLKAMGGLFGTVKIEITLLSFTLFSLRERRSICSERTGTETMNPSRVPSSQQSDEDRKRVHASVNAFSRVIAVMVMMMLPGVAGYFLDRWFGTRFLIVIGIILGLIIAIFGLIFVAKQANEELREKKNR